MTTPPEAPGELRPLRFVAPRDPGPPPFVSERPRHPSGRETGATFGNMDPPPSLATVPHLGSAVFEGQYGRTHHAPAMHRVALYLDLNLAYQATPNTDLFSLRGHGFLPWRLHFGTFPTTSQSNSHDSTTVHDDSSSS
eukprot:16434352-Heterocapsa_arctica.AAC.1